MPRRTKPCRVCGSHDLPHARCETCGRVLHGGEWPFCPHGKLTPGQAHVYSGRKLWTGHEVYGKKLREQSEGTAERWARAAAKDRADRKKHMRPSVYKKLFGENAT